MLYPIRLFLFVAVLFLGGSVVETQAGGTVLGLHDFARPSQEDPPSFAFNPPTPEKAELGRRLFFDPILSKSNSLSCASCHIQEFGWTDTVAMSLGDDGDLMARRTQPLLGIGWSPKFGWDGAIDSLEGFALAPIAREREMNQDLDEMVAEIERSGTYAADMRAAFGTPDVKISRISQSLATFMRTLSPPETSFDRWVAGDESAVSESAKKGFDLFVGKARCANCHISWRFTDDGFHDIGLQATEDTGRGTVEGDDPSMRFAFKTPTLRGVSLRPPFMHDGSSKTLAEAVEHYVSGIRDRPSRSPSLDTITLSDREKLNVVDFLKTL